MAVLIPHVVSCPVNNVSIWRVDFCDWRAATRHSADYGEESQ
ncbi:hypothetical protein BH24PSE2_BH24PSE2_19740 [soil metagenome]